MFAATSVDSVRSNSSDPQSETAVEHTELPPAASMQELQIEAAVVETGLKDAYIELIVPDILPIGETLVCDVAIKDAKPGFEGMLLYYLDDVPVLAKRINSDIDIPGIKHDFEYSHKLPETVEIKVVLKCTTIFDDFELISAEAIVTLENHSKSHWMEQEAERVLAEVSDRYQGDFTLQWAINNDYSDFDKEVFVNMKGYQSRTEYLIWVNLAHQRVNVFKGSAGEWELIESFIVGTGAPRSGTKRGVTTITFKQTEWHFGSYICRPITRFWPGTGYAFHSRKLHPVTGEPTDPGIGYPISAGCVRMYNEDAEYIYDNIPLNTTVVVH